MEEAIKTPPTVDNDDKYNLDHLNGGEVATPPQQEPEKPAAAESPAAAPSPQHDPHLVALAKDLGFTDDQIKSIPPAQLSQSVTYWTRIRLQEERAQRERERERERQQPAPAASPAPEEGEDDLSEVHPAIRKRLESQQKDREEITQLKEQLKQQQQLEQARQGRTIDAAVDAAIEALPKKFQKILGAGEGRLLARDSKELRKRLMIFQQAGIDPRIDSEAVMRRKFTKAAEEVFGDVLADDEPARSGAAAAAVDEAGDTEPDETAPPPAPAAKKNGKPAKEEWDEAGLATPTGRKSPPRKGDEAAVEAMRAWKLKNGHTPKNDQRPADLEGIE